jgi:predicted porin
MWADDSVAKKWFHVDGQPSSTRFGILGSGQLTPGLRAGMRLETEMKSNPSDTVNFATPSVTNTFAERWLDASLEGAWGRVNMGQGSGAADDASTLDLSGTAMPNGNCTSDWGGGIAWRDSAGATLATTPLVKDAINCRDFESRLDRIMYTTPTFGGFRAQFGQGQKDNTGESTEASVWYSGKLGGDFAAALGWSSVNTSTPAGAKDRETFGGSASWAANFGLTLTLSATRTQGVSTLRDAAPAADPDRTGKIWWGKVGWKFAGGQHAVAVDYGVFKDLVARDDEAKTVGIGYTWAPTRWADLYAAYHVHSLDRPGVSVEDVKVAVMGTRLKF